MKGKWIVAAVLAVAALLCIVCLCFRPKDVMPLEDSGLPTLRLLTVGESDAASVERVSEALSQITTQQLGCGVELIIISPSEYDDYIENLVYRNDSIDILFCSGREALEQLSDDSCIYRLDRYLVRYPEFKECVSDQESWLATSVGGYCYGIPLGNDESIASGFLMREDLCRELGVAAGDVTNLQELEWLLLRVRDKYPDLIPVVPHYGHMENFTVFDTQAHNAVGAVQEGAYISITDLEEFSELCRVMYAWHEQELILRHATLSDDSRTSWIGNGLAFGSFAWLDSYTQRQAEYELGMELECVYLSDAQEVRYRRSDCFCIYAYTQDVELSLSLLRLLYTDSQVRQLCVYGQEGIDYTYAEDGSAVPMEAQQTDRRYVSWHWPLLEQLCPPWSTEDDFANVQAGSTIPFWSLDSGEISVELYQCGRVMDKYFDALCAGIL